MGSFLNNNVSVQNRNNIVKAIEAAKSKKMEVIIFTGADGGKINSFNCTKLKVQTNNVARIQEAHILIGHIISKYIEENI